MGKSVLADVMMYEKLGCKDQQDKTKHRNKDSWILIKYKSNSMEKKRPFKMIKEQPDIHREMNLDLNPISSALK